MFISSRVSHPGCYTQVSCLTSLSLWEGREERAGRVLCSKMPTNAVKDSRNGIHSVSAIPYAEGVVFQSPGSAPPRMRQSATLGDCRAERLTPKALYRTFDGRFILVERLRRTCFLRLFTQGARPTTATPRHPRPWALEYNRFAVKSQTAALRMMRSTTNP